MSLEGEYIKVRLVEKSRENAFDAWINPVYLNGISSFGDGVLIKNSEIEVSEFPPSLLYNTDALI